MVSHELDYKLGKESHKSQIFFRFVDHWPPWSASSGGISGDFGGAGGAFKDIKDI